MVLYTAAKLHLQSGSGTSAITVNTNNRVGIGTTTPRARLEVVGDGASISASIAKLQWNGSGDPIGGGFPATATGLAVATQGGILAGAHWLVSDERVKNAQGRTDSTADLNTLLDIEVTDYQFKDFLTKGDGSHKKVIAQQVEKVYSQAVSKVTDVVPDIFKRGFHRDGWIQLATDLEQGDRVKLISENAEGIYEVSEATQDRFRTDFKPEAHEVFVYGREVDDFRIVDYEAIAMLNLSATQELHHRLEAQEVEMVRLRTVNAALNQKLASMESRDRVFKARLARLEEAMVNPPLAQTASLNSKS